ncbi:hypothetical protein TNCV_4227741 [Trichonephila clavipes]|nr:hypothetical protein TNCV_4227741 [Trichonephila clavipes]
MGKKCDLSPCKKAEVKALGNGKLFQNRKILPRLKVSEASVRRIKKKIESGDELSPKRKKKMRQKAYFRPKVCFSDETPFEIFQNKDQFVRRRRGEKFHSDCVVQTVKHPTKVMICQRLANQLAVALRYVSSRKACANERFVRVLSGVSHKAQGKFRWSTRADVLRAQVTNRNEIKNSLEDLIEDNTQTSDTVDKTSEILQREKLNLLCALKDLHTLPLFLSEKRSKFDDYEAKGLQLANVPEPNYEKIRKKKLYSHEKRDPDFERMSPRERF